ncbi:glutaminyl-peptide cyclotransferase [Phlebotomus argentipes]|uniref:glutaminyl-peptide cyclotransferase n=1 Tax=Phlebotomus argentipes TaxID=94469 RepID=UPI00289304A8|nr:glutaminyl-peptide cyclotransferase [Phlebotomus argentipes]
MEVSLVVGLFLLCGSLLVEVAGREREPKQLQDHELHRILKSSDTEHFSRVLGEICIPRVVGSAGHEKVRNFMIQELQDLGWSVSTDSFEDATPNMGVLTFHNIIATPHNASKYIVLAAHYDSKYFRDFDFLGATDSAVPCAMIINLAHTLHQELQETPRHDVGLMVVFFDGEEAFETWSDKDSIYGARHLAKRWEREGFLPRIEVLVLLDLLGAPDPNFYSYFTTTERQYNHLMMGERRLLRTGMLDNYSYSSVADKKPAKYFQPYTWAANIEDDHIPFLRRGVPILHVIPSPFPHVWHKATDDLAAVDLVAVENLNRILRLFIVEQLHLNLA